MIAIYPELLQLAGEGDFETLAIRTRKYFCGEGEATKPQLDLLHMSQNMGIALKSSNHSFFATIICVDRQGEFKVSGLINEAFQPTDQRFLLAHLLGHLFLHIVPKVAKSEIDGSLGYQESSCPLKVAYNETISDPLEQAATDFALALLMPKGMFLRARDRLKQVRAVANFFGLHPHAVELRHRRLEHDFGQMPRSFSMAEKLVEEEKALRRQGAEGKGLKGTRYSERMSVSGMKSAASAPSIKVEPIAKGKIKTRSSDEVPASTKHDPILKEEKKRPNLSQRKQAQEETAAKPSPIQASVAHLKGMEKIRLIAKIIEEQKQGKEDG